MVLIEIAGLIVYGMATRRLSLWWLGALAWVGILGLLTFASASDWVTDQSQSPAWRTDRA